MATFRTSPGLSIKSARYLKPTRIEKEKFIIFLFFDFTRDRKLFQEYLVRQVKIWLFSPVQQSVRSTVAYLLLVQLFQRQVRRFPMRLDNISCLHEEQLPSINLKRRSARHHQRHRRQAHLPKNDQSNKKKKK